MTYDSMFKGADLRTEEDGLRHEGAGRGLERRANLRLEQVAQGQYVVSDTRCPALCGCKSE